MNPALEHESLMGTLDVIKEEKESLSIKFPHLKQYLDMSLDEVLQAYNLLVSKKKLVVEKVSNYFSTRWGDSFAEARDIAKNPFSFEGDLHELRVHPMIEIRKLVARNPNTSLRTLEEMKRSVMNDGIISSFDILVHPSTDNKYIENYVRHSTTVPPDIIKWLVLKNKSLKDNEKYVEAENNYNLTFYTLKMLLSDDYSSKDYMASVGVFELHGAERLVTENEQGLRQVLQDKLSLYRDKSFPIEHIEKMLESDSALEVFAAGASASALETQTTASILRLKEMGENDLAIRVETEKGISPLLEKEEIKMDISTEEKAPFHHFKR